MQPGLQAFWNIYRRSVGGVVGLAIIMAMVLLALSADLLASASPFALSADALFPPSSRHLMGTDDLGRDIFSGVVHGSRVSLLVGLLAAGASTLVGICLGGLSGFYGGAIDDLLMRLTEFFMVIPRFFLALVIIALFGPSIWGIILVLTILSWPMTARLFRAEVLRLKSQEYVVAARAIGCGDLKILFRQILPNALAPVIVNISVQVAYAIILEAGLSFLGLGDPATRSWGVMLSNAQQFLRRAWWTATFPGLAIFLAVLGFNLVGDGLNDALNPRLKQRTVRMESIKLGST
ncbi:MAG TPA: ABC transporter permease [Candidatus Methylomirabilis sp.]|nr:ABC transporter permease [Candidatus Methylomirabilis sp.]HSB79460.1 ABC transporter permease [Candidatus Methylomirabilis sp.]HSC70751.1 ABC transporter permease [Candidatus Methylomirabilis sp.]